jgi:hypothetical protein
MIIESWDQEGQADAVIVSNEGELLEFFATFPRRDPFYCELVQGGHKLSVCIRKDLACVQHSASNNDPPYMMAVAPERCDFEGEVEFFIGNEATPITVLYALPLDVAKQVIVHFLTTGQPSSAVSWEEV